MFMKKRYIFVVIIVIGIFFTRFHTVSSDGKQDIELNGILWKNNDYSVETPVQCIVNGTVTKSTFSGNLFVVSQQYIVLNIDVDIVFNDDFGLIRDFDGNTYGMFIMTENAEQFVILLYEDMLSTRKSWTSANSFVISAPADNRYEAVQLIRDMGNNNDFLQNITWN